MPTDTKEYLAKKKFFDQVLTIFGRKPVLEALSDPNLECFRLHLADSNKPAAIIEDITSRANARNIEVAFHSKQALSRISKNAKQDQGVALDLVLKGFSHCEDFFQGNAPRNFELIALDNITNPQNLGMIIRSVCASPVTGILLPQNGCANLDSLVIKASAGTLFKAKILRCKTLSHGLELCRENGAKLIGLDSNSTSSIQQLSNSSAKVFILGNETDGVSPKIKKMCDQLVSIPMKNNVESLNVAVTAAILAFRSVL